MSGDRIRGAIIDIQTAARHMTMANGENFDSPDKSHWFGRGMDSLKEGLGILGFDLVPRKTPAEAHAEAIAARTAEDAHDDDLLSQTGLCDCGYCQARERGLADDGSDIEGGR